MQKRRTRAVLAIAGVIVVAVGITVTSVTVANAEAAETTRLCVSAQKGVDLTRSLTGDSTRAADNALTAVKSVDLPGGEEWKSTSYADRPGADAAGTKPTRPSGASLTNAVTVGRNALVKTKPGYSCSTRDQAKALNAQSKKLKAEAKTLGADTDALLTDFAAFQGEEHARVAAEVEAARKAAEAAAAQKAAEEEAARRAAAEEAAREAAARESAPSRSSGSGSTGSGSGGGATPPRAPLGGGVGGGGQVGSGAGGCITSNGMGGTTRC